MFRSLPCTSSGAHDYNVVYHVGRRLSWVAVGWRLGAGRLE